MKINLNCSSQMEIQICMHGTQDLSSFGFCWCPCSMSSRYLTTRGSLMGPRSHTLVPMLWHASAYRNSTISSSANLWRYQHSSDVSPLEVLPNPGDPTRIPQHLEQTSTATLHAAMVYLPPSLSCLSKSFSRVELGLTHLSTPCLALC